jgi:hypothetical protein
VRFDGRPPQMKLTQINPMVDFTGGGGWGPKPTGMISVRGKLYLAVQNLRGWMPPVRGRSSQHGTDAHILQSSDLGKTWSPGRQQITQPMFPGPRFGGPAFINFGKDNDGARDTFVYAVSSDQWDNGSEIRLGRVPADAVVDAGAWQWVAGWNSDATPCWSKWLNDSIPILSAPRVLSCPDMVYLASIGRYLLLTWCLHKDFDPSLGTDLQIYDAPEPWGPFTLAHYHREWLGRRLGAYCPRLPLKWLDADGLGGWMLASGDWMVEHDPARPYYRPNAVRWRLRLR